MLKCNRMVMTAALAVCSLGIATAADMKGMNDMQKMDMSQPAAKQAQGTGVVKAVDAKAGTITIAHDPIKDLNWPAMTMTFKVSKFAALNNVAAGKKVQFTLEGKDNPMITSLKVME